ncbi:GNAT family N-acetyltransferase [Nitratidesulfovibrio termitidis]|uniref:GNAT family N-acetyltransferase n=1 Tax=Nitratidesulfovibrio termitidis TaxID=42252 RepID=UPI0004032E98|nr:GNAT family N-acetyltransferase [Nitratidesulfovibrio termitidis]
MTTHYRLEETTPGAQWDAFVEASPNGTIFSLSAYLAAVRQPSRLYWCMNGNERRAAVAVTESADGTCAVQHDFVIHNGILFAPPANKQNRSTVLSERFEIAADVAAALSRRYTRVELALSPQVTDIRPFLWHNYGKDDAPHYVADVRYTAYASLAGFADAAAPEDVPLFPEISYSRRQEVRKALKTGVRTTEDATPEDLAAFYALTMGRQDIEVERERLDELRDLAAAVLAGGFGRLFATRTPEGELAAMALFGMDSKRAYYLFGAGDPHLRNTPCGTAVLWDAFGQLARAGVTEVDLEGVNSPRRGWFKLSFGADILPYYQLVKEGSEPAEPAELSVPAEPN